LLIRPFKLIQKSTILVGKRSLREQVRATLPCTTQGALPPPTANASMVTGKQDVGHSHPLKISRAGIVRAL
jgi:hypothetical protein